MQPHESEPIYGTGAIPTEPKTTDEAAQESIEKKGVEKRLHWAVTSEGVSQPSHEGVYLYPHPATRTLRGLRVETSKYAGTNPGDFRDREEGEGRNFGTPAHEEYDVFRVVASRASQTEPYSIRLEKLGHADNRVSGYQELLNTLSAQAMEGVDQEYWYKKIGIAREARRATELDRRRQVLQAIRVTLEPIESSVTQVSGASLTASVPREVSWDGDRLVYREGHPKGGWRYQEDAVRLTNSGRLEWGSQRMNRYFGAALQEIRQQIEAVIGSEAWKDIE